jgi:hypothetical protein
MTDGLGLRQSPNMHWSCFGERGSDYRFQILYVVLLIWFYEALVSPPFSFSHCKSDSFYKRDPSNVHISNIVLNLVTFLKCSLV